MREIPPRNKEKERQEKKVKSVLISIQPKWCELIASGKKTVEVRKTRPKLETPFKVYIYCTKGEKIYLPRDIFGNEALNGKVIGEFVCDEMTPLFNVATTSWNLLAGNVHEYAKGLVRMARLTEEEMHSYAKGKNCYAWHISNLVIYDKPRELSEFYHYCGDDPNCDGCEAHYYSNTECGKEDYCCSPIEGCKPLKRPPQSWCYVESEGEG